MSEYNPPVRSNGKTLLIVEGDHEKDKLFHLLFRCFPELNISEEDVLIYGTNIYMLNEEIIKEYGTQNWELFDVDLPFLISRKLQMSPLLYKIDFSNILIVFDYERQDPKFREITVTRMQEYFSDPTDMGMLYINYPMVEAYAHSACPPDPHFEDLYIQAQIQRGSVYKSLVKDTYVTKWMSFPEKLRKQLVKILGLCVAEADNCAESILNSMDQGSLNLSISEAVNLSSQEKARIAGSYYFPVLISEYPFVSYNMNYWEFLRKLFAGIVRQNLCKANKITGGEYDIRPADLASCYRKLNLKDVLTAQNLASQDSATGIIWVLNTCLFFLADFSFFIEQELQQA